MFGRRPDATPTPPQPSRPAPAPAPVAQAPAPAPPPAPLESLREEPLPVNPSAQRTAEARDQVLNLMKDAVDLAALARLKPEQARQEIATAVSAIIRYRNLDLNEMERQGVIKEIIDEVLGYGPLEPLLARDDIADIMINGYDTCYIETAGKITQVPIRFRDNAHLLNICQRIVSAVGRRVDESSPICDARLPDGSRVNVIIPPLAVDGATLTIRKFKRDKLTLDKLIGYGTISESAAKVLKVAGTCRINVIVSGGTGSGKTTMLNCLTRYIDNGERVVTCEDACELQLQQRHVVRLETRPRNLEGAGEATMRDLVKNCLRMRPDRIIVGEVRGSEAFDLLQAMNTGHDGSMGTVHANSPREGIARIENMVAMANLNIPIRAVREQIASAVGLIVQIKRLRDGTRKVTHITEVTGMEGDVVTLQDLVVFDYLGEDANGKIIGRHRATGVRPGFWEQARYYGMERELLDAMEDTAQ